MCGVPSASRPVYGYPVRVVLPEGARVVWWGTDDRDDDVLAADDGRVLSWPDLDACLAAVRAQGWDEAAPDDAPDVLDLGPAVRWLEDRHGDVDPAAALAVWNLATDVVASTGAAWDDRGALDDACHEKLTFATVPWLVGRDEYTPEWTAEELDHLRRRIAASLALVRGAFAP